VANARIERVGPDEYELICDLYNAVYRPHVDTSFFERRLGNRRNVLTMVANLDGRPVGFSCGYELRPSTYYSWLYGVLPDARQLGVGSQLMAAELAWAHEHGYEMARLECYNHYRPMILLAVKSGYDIVGIRWDSHTSNNLVIFERNLAAEEEG
jgi:GNAT superfamily N-acetyltransferase